MVTSSPVLPPAPAAATLYVIERGWHSDIGLPVSELHGRLAASIAPRFPGVRYLVFGFGERAYLLGHDQNPIELLLALLPHPGAIMVTALAAPPEAAFGRKNVVMLQLPRASFNAVTTFVWSFLKKNRRGLPEPIAWGPYPGSLYYASTGTYALAFTCNTWTADALHATGLPIHVAGVVFSGQLMSQVRQLAVAAPVVRLAR